MFSEMKGDMKCFRVSNIEIIWCRISALYYDIIQSFDIINKYQIMYILVHPEIKVIRIHLLEIHV